MQRLNILGAVVAHIIYLSSILIFVMRMVYKSSPGHWIGIPFFLMAFPLMYLLWKAPQFDRPVLYYIQVGLMLLWMAAGFLLDYVYKIDFRQDLRVVIPYITFYVAGLGGMIGVSANAGHTWTISAVILFFITTALAFIQRSVTGY